MRAVLQRVAQAQVDVGGERIASIGQGFLVLLGACDTDTQETARRMADKICKLRIFQDGDGKTNLSLGEVGGELLVVSQFTLYADCRKGNRPSFIKAGDPKRAEELYEYFAQLCKNHIGKVEQGSFGADMKVQLVNDGPFTLVLDSEQLFGI